MKQYVVVYEQTPNNWCAYVPDLAGCVATAATRKEVETTIREAAAFHIAGLLTDNELVPEPGAWTGWVEVDEEGPIAPKEYSLAERRAEQIRPRKINPARRRAHR